MSSLYKASSLLTAAQALSISYSDFTIGHGSKAPESAFSTYNTTSCEQKEIGLRAAFCTLEPIAPKFDLSFTISPIRTTYRCCTMETERVAQVVAARFSRPRSRRNGSHQVFNPYVPANPGRRPFQTFRTSPPLHSRSQFPPFEYRHLLADDVVETFFLELPQDRPVFTFIVAQSGRSNHG